MGTRVVLVAPLGSEGTWVGSKGMGGWKDRRPLEGAGWEALKECGRGIKEGRRGLRASVGDSVPSQLFHNPLLQVLGAERCQGHLVDHTHPYPHDHLGMPGPAFSRRSSGISYLRKRGLHPLPARTGWGWLNLCFSPQINFFIFIRILGILLSKLRTRQMRCPDYRLRWGRRGRGPGVGRRTWGRGPTATLSPQAGPLHADAGAPAGCPRGGVCSCDRGAGPGCPALGQTGL